MSATWTVARREVRSLFDQPTGYVLLIVFVAINAFLFFRNAWISNLATLRPMLDFLPWLLLFFVPAVAMRSLAEDNRNGMLEIVLAQPISETELLFGKYLGVVLVLFMALAYTLLIPLGIATGSALPLGPVIAQYIGAALLVIGMAGVGVWASSLTRSQITAFILGVAVMFILILFGLDPLLVGLGPTLGAIAARIGVLSHFENIGRGVLDLRDVLYFLSLAAVFLALAYAAIMRRRLTPRGAAAKRLRIGTLLLVLVLIAVNLAGGEIGGRIDLTPGHAYTLSPASREIAGGLKDIVTVTLFASKELPAEFALSKRDVTDLLRDLKSAGHGRIRVLERDPGTDSSAANDARTLGIEPVQFNVVGQSELQVKNGFFGIAIQAADKHETIPFVQRTDDLEYRLASAIRELTEKSKPQVALATDPQAGQFSALQTELAKTYQVSTPVLGDSTPLPAGLGALIVVASRDSLPQAALDKVRAYLDGGGRMLLFESGMAVSPQGPFASARPVTYNPVLKPYGVQIRQDMVYDLRANEVISVPTNFGSLLRPYPYFIRATSAKGSPITAELTGVDLPWTSSIDTGGPHNGTVTPLLLTTDAAGHSSGTAIVDPGQTLPRDSLAQRIVAVQVVGKGARPARVVAVGNSMMASDEFAQRNPADLAFTLNAVDWLAQDEALIAIRAKNRTPPPLTFSGPALKQAVKYANLIGLPLAIAFLGLIHTVRRQRRASTPYRRLAPGPRAA